MRIGDRERNGRGAGGGVGIRCDHSVYDIHHTAIGGYRLARPM